jgi:hypothetical protein
MRNLLKASGMVTAIAFAAYAPSAVAQEITETDTCQAVGGGAPEPLGDREGHTISVDAYSCRVDSGPLSGGVLTGSGIWEWNGSNSVWIAGYGVVRKPSATVVYQQTEGKLTLTTADGKVTGWTFSGKGHWLMATGSAASLAGKSYTVTAKSTGPGQFTSESKME